MGVGGLRTRIKESGCEIVFRTNDKPEGRTIVLVDYNNVVFSIMSADERTRLSFGGDVNKHITKLRKFLVRLCSPKAIKCVHLFVGGAAADERVDIKMERLKELGSSATRKIDKLQNGNCSEGMDDKMNGALLATAKTMLMTIASGSYDAEEQCLSKLKVNWCERGASDVIVRAYRAVSPHVHGAEIVTDEEKRAWRDRFGIEPERLEDYNVFLISDDTDFLIVPFMCPTSTALAVMPSPSCGQQWDFETQLVGPAELARLFGINQCLLLIVGLIADNRLSLSLDFNLWPRMRRGRKKLETSIARVQDHYYELLSKIGINVLSKVTLTELLERSEARDIIALCLNLEHDPSEMDLLIEKVREFEGYETEHAHRRIATNPINGKTEDSFPIDFLDVQVNQRRFLHPYPQDSALPEVNMLTKIMRSAIIYPAALSDFAQGNQPQRRGYVEEFYRDSTDNVVPASPRFLNSLIDFSNTDEDPSLAYTLCFAALCVPLSDDEDVLDEFARQFVDSVKGREMSTSDVFFHSFSIVMLRIVTNTDEKCLTPHHVDLIVKALSRQVEEGNSKEFVHIEPEPRGRIRGGRPFEDFGHYGYTRSERKGEVYVAAQTAASLFCVVANELWSVLYWLCYKKKIDFPASDMLTALCTLSGSWIKRVFEEEYAAERGGGAREEDRQYGRLFDTWKTFVRPAVLSERTPADLAGQLEHLALRGD